MTAKVDCLPFRRFGRVVLAVALVCLQASCMELDLGLEPSTAASAPVPAEQPSAARPLPVALQGDNIDPRFRPAPELFIAENSAVWDGLRTLQGIWIAHPATAEARRVRITNIETGAAVDGAMFRRDPGLPGPEVVVSSEAATLLGLTPGHPTRITVAAIVYGTAPVPESVATASPHPDGPIEIAATPAEAFAPEEAAVPAAAAETAAGEVPPDAPAGTNAAASAAAEIPDAPAPGAAQALLPEPLAPPIVPAPTAAAPEAPPPTAIMPEIESPTAAVRSAAAAPAAMPVPRPVRAAAAAPASIASAGKTDVDAEGGEIADGLRFIQAGIFGDAENAVRLVERLRAADLPAAGLAVTAGTRQLTRVVVGPFRTVAERDAALGEVRRIGPADAVPVRG